MVTSSSKSNNIIVIFNFIFYLCRVRKELNHTLKTECDTKSKHIREMICFFCRAFFINVFMHNSTFHCAVSWSTSVCYYFIGIVYLYAMLWTHLHWMLFICAQHFFLSLVRVRLPLSIHGGMFVIGFFCSISIFAHNTVNNSSFLFIRKKTSAENGQIINKDFYYCENWSSPSTNRKNYWKKWKRIF